MTERSVTYNTFTLTRDYKRPLAENRVGLPHGDEATWIMAAVSMRSGAGHAIQIPAMTAAAPAPWALADPPRKLA